MAYIWDFIIVLHALVDEHFPNTTRYIIDGGDFIEDVVMELREGDKKIKVFTI